MPAASSLPASLLNILRQPVTGLQALLLLALALGGGGIVYGFRHFAIQAFALFLLAFHASAAATFLRVAPPALVGLIAATLALPLLQIIPLPPALWQALPGRELVLESLVLAGYSADSWHPVSVDYVRSLLAFCALIAPVTLIILAQGSSQAHRTRLVWTVLLAALVILGLGFIQLNSANTIGITQRITPDPDVLYGTFSNRNSMGLFCVITAVFCVVMSWGNRPGWNLAFAAAGALLALGAVLTQSRTSMVLLTVPLALFGLRALAGLRGTYEQAKGQKIKSRWQAWVVALTLCVLPLGLVISVLSGGRAAESIARFSNFEQDRIERWDDGAFTLDRYWPVGAGMGSFDDIFQIDESLEYLAIARAGRAHNDYLELAIESGAIGLLLLLGWALFSIAGLVRPTEGQDRWLRIGSAAALACIAMQSFLDYPLRNQALLMLGAVCICLLSWRRERAT